MSKSPHGVGVRSGRVAAPGPVALGGSCYPSIPMSARRRARYRARASETASMRCRSDFVAGGPVRPCACRVHLPHRRGDRAPWAPRSRVPQAGSTAAVDRELDLPHEEEPRTSSRTARGRMRRPGRLIGPLAVCPSPRFEGLAALLQPRPSRRTGAPFRTLFATLLLGCPH